MKLTLSDKHNVNYVGTYTTIKSIRKHTNADKLQIASVLGNNVVVGLDSKAEDYGFYFPLESQLQPKFLSEYNLYRDKTLNSDNTKSGFFELNGRIRAVKLRGEKSEGIFIPVNLGIKETDFDTIDDVLVVKKYTVIQQQAKEGKTKSDKKIVKKFDRIVENQFRFHIDTAQLKKNIHQLNLNDYIGIHYKKHGTSWVVGKVLTNKQLTWYEKLVQKIGIPYYK